MPLISLQQVTKSYGSRTVIHQVSFSINEGDKIALIGSNGAGKTTLLRMIEGKESPDEGKVFFHAGTTAGFLSQNLEDLLLSDSPIKNPELHRMEMKLKELSHLLSFAKGEELKALLREYDKINAHYEAQGGYDYEHRIKEVLSGLGLSPDAADRPISSFSGGERMRISLAKLVVMRPNVLFLDEPTNHLDTTALSWLETYLRSYGGAVFFISHDRYFIDATANRVIELENGAIQQYKGNYSDYYRQKEEFIRDQQRVIQNLAREVERQEEVTQTMLSHRKMKSYHAREKLVEKLSDRLSSEKAKIQNGPSRMNFSFVPDAEIANKDKILIEAKSVSMAFPNCEPLFQNVSFLQKATEKIFLVGPNGCGKTTLLSLLLGKLPDFEGTVLIQSNSKFGYMGQFVPFEDEEKEILDELLSRTDLTNTQGRTLLARFGFRDIDVFKKINVLSGGERSRLYLCCLLQEKPDMLFLDEPTNHLDIYSREVLEDALCEYHGAILAVSHDRFFVEKCADRILGFYKNEVLPFYNFKGYQLFLKNKEATVLPSSSEKKEKKEHTKNVNRAQERKDTAKKKERLRFLETEIERLENEQGTLESTFGKDTPLEDYKKYEKNQSALSSFYEEYMALEEGM